MRLFYILVFTALIFSSVFSYSQSQPQIVLPSGHSETVANLEFNQTGNHLLSCGYDGLAILWDVAKEKSIIQFDHGKGISSAILSKNEKLIATFGVGVLKLWDSENGDLLFIKRIKSSIANIRFSYDGNKIIIGGWNDSTVNVFDTKTGSELLSLKLNGNIEKVEVNRDSNHILVIRTETKDKIKNSIVEIIDIQNRVIEHRFPPSQFIKLASFSPDGKYIVIKYDYDATRVYVLKTYAKVFQVPAYAIETYNFTADGKIFMVANGSDLKTYDCESWKRKDSISISYGKTNLYTKSDELLTISEDGRYVFTTQNSAKVNLITWNVKFGKCITFLGVYDIQKHKSIYQFNVCEDATGNIKFSPNGRYVASSASILSSEKGEIKIWNFNTGKEIYSLKPHIPTILYLCTSKDNRIYSACSDSTIKVWDLNTGKIIKSLSCTNAFMGHAFLTISNDGSILALNAFDRSDNQLRSLITIWETKNFTVLSKKDYPLYASYGKISADNKYLTYGQSNIVIDIPYGKNIISSSNNTYSACAFGNLKVIEQEDSIFILDDKNGNIKKVLPKFKKNKKNKSIYFSFIGCDYFIITYQDTVSEIYTIKDWRNLYTLHGEFSFSESCTNNILVTIDKNNLIKIRTTSNGKLINYKITSSFKYSGMFPRITSDEKSLIYSIENDSVIIYDLEKGCLKLQFQISGKLIDYLPTQNMLLCSQSNKFSLYDANTGILSATFINLENNEGLVYTPNLYYSISTNGSRYLSWKSDGKLYDFGLWEKQFNRPDKVLEAFQSKDTFTIGLYRNAYLKFLNRNPNNKTEAISVQDLPSIEILNSDELENVVTKNNAKIKLRVTKQKGKSKVIAINIIINGSPLFGFGGLKFLGEGTSDSIIETSIKLTTGRNTLKTYCINTSGQQSITENVVIFYEPSKIREPNLVYIGIGISNYENKEFNLKYASKDIVDFSNVIKTQFHNSQIILLTNKDATLEKILALKKNILDKTNPDDIVIISISGHGLIDKGTNEFYFATYSMDFSSPSKRGLSYAEIQSLLDSIPARQKLVLLDACHSGELDRESILEFNTMPDTGKVHQIRGSEIIWDASNAQGIGMKNAFKIMQELFRDNSLNNGSVIISASAGTEFAYEGNNWNNGVFTYCVIKGLYERLADLNGDSLIRVSELQSYVSENVEILTAGKQSPTSRQANYDNDWIIWK